ncbi:MAG: cystathionine beta-lyase [Phycisphaerae bacterium]|nr:cystathionine beta-lyase [Phycisphaerae bacterium]MBM91428.1 cystathionine beta-lyase [Phycisphaerae bacterium]MBM92704.1 cystathionine beta-lyase [Phycisphaerae bacterium]HCT44626.1 cystathionine beta-lyase [Phycisphaerales bacterium]
MAFDPVQSLSRVQHEFGEHGGVNMSIEASTTYTVMDAGIMPEIFGGRMGPDTGGCYLYGRHFNPTVYVLGRYLAAIEGTEAGYATSSGISAIACTLMQLCGPGDEIVASNAIYGGTFALLKEYLPAKTGINVRFVDISNLDEVKGAISEKTKVVYTESISNPTMVVADLPKLADMAHDAGAQLVVDNTFSPMLLSPAQQGADIVVHSLTKFIGGCSDIIAGAVCASKEFISQLMDLHMGSIMLLGPTMDPRVAFDLSLRLPHLGLRMREHSRRAQFFAEKLESLGLDVSYPGLESHPQHAMLGKMLNAGFGHGGLFAIDLGDKDRAFAFMNDLQQTEGFGFLAVSLGYFDTLMSCSASSTSSELTDEELAEAGIKPGLVRVSLGYTGTLEDRWAQFERALRRVGAI